MFSGEERAEHPVFRACERFKNKRRPGPAQGDPEEKQ